MIEKDNGTMPEKKSDYSLLMYALMFVIFILLAILGACIILFLPANVSGPADGPAGSSYHSSALYGSDFFIDGISQENQSGLQYARNGSFSGTWHYIASSDPPENGSCLILALVDYKLMPLYYNGSLADSHTIRYQSPVSANVSFNLTGLQEGFHDVLFLTARNPYADPLLIPGHVIPRDVDGNGMLFNVIEGNDTRPDPRYGMGPLDKYVSYRNVSGKNLLGYGPWLTEHPFADLLTADGGRPSGNAIYNMEVAPGEDIDYYINVKNGVGSGNERFDRFALLQLLDYSQVPIRTDMPEYVYYGALGPGRFIAIHAGIKAPETPGTHVLTLVLEGYPYESRENGVYSTVGIVTIILDVKT